MPDPKLCNNHRIKNRIEEPVMKVQIKKQIRIAPFKVKEEIEIYHCDSIVCTGDLAYMYKGGFVQRTEEVKNIKILKLS